ncbi:MAG: extracellular solute-binding protein [Solirubrobacterales bacterium]|nr:extracellular solute-binding protein [Solirubrobacterales bacterium]
MTSESSPRGPATGGLRSLLGAAVLAGALALAACGSDGGTTDQATAPEAAAADQPSTGTLRVFAYEDSVTPEMMDPYQEQNPDLNIKTATFDSDSEAAAKLAGGFEADVVEVCLDEAEPLLRRDLLRPLDTAGVTDWDQIAFHDSEGVKSDGQTIMVPLSAGPLGVLYNSEEVPEGIDSYADLYDPRFAGNAAIEGDYALPAIAETALALGIEDPMNMDQEELSKVSDYMDEHRAQFRSLWRSDSDLVNLFKSGEVVVSDGSTAQAERMKQAGLPVEWVEPTEGTISWVCGFGITSKAQNIQAAYRLINWQASPRAQAIRGKNGYVVTNPEALPLVPDAQRKTADPSALDQAIPETYPPIYDQWVRAFEQFQASG